MDRIVATRISRRRILGASLAAPAIALVPGGLMRVAAQDKTVVTMVTDTAGLGDQNFNDLADAGGKKAATDLGIEWKVIESLDATAYAPNLSAAADQSQMVVATGYLLSLAMQEMVADYPDVSFLIVDAVVDSPNVLSVVFKENEPSFLVGVASGLTTKTNKVGVVGGQRIPPVIRYEDGFRAGVAAVNPDCEVLVAYVDSFGDPTKGKEFALAQFNDGADIVFPVAGATGIGCYQAVAELNKPGEQWVIGADVSQDHLAPGFELCVSRKGVDWEVTAGIEAYTQGTFAAGTTLNLGIADGGVAYEDPNNRVAADITAKVKEYEAQIVDGTLTIPATDDELTVYLGGTPVASPTA